MLLVSGVSICIAGHNPSTKSVSFDDSLPAENLTASPYYRMPIDDAEHLDPHLDPMQGYEFFFIVDMFISGEDILY